MQRFDQVTVHKFGGSSLADAQCFKRVSQLLKDAKTVVVVSAMGGVTGILNDILQRAMQGGDYNGPLNQLVQRTKETALSLGLSQELLKNLGEQEKILIEEGLAENEAFDKEIEERKK